ncbi:plasma membrane SNARE protein (Sec9) [Venturia nashicola]|uniref:Plasma membrane SNARE protein (Sec9) n=1 Tax=Venturia nashicola TaxID=86259 RepID=A0A4Z1NSP2_9PEZI|nr:plasma membrane SNARE protein (Sec9) [Venturia nashicola]
MKKFGLKRNKDKGDSSRSESPANSNPYAQAPAADPYTSNSNTPPPAYNGPPSGGSRQDKSAGNASGYGAPSPPVTEGRYAAPAAGGGGYGGYGQGGSRYGSSEGGNAAPTGSRYGGGGYGGFGGAPQADAGPASTSRYGGGAPAAAPNSRYGGEASDAAPTSRYGGGAPDAGQSRYGGGAPGPAGGQSGYGAPVGGRYGGAPAAYGAEQDRAGASEWETGRGNGQSQGYGAYEDRVLTAEEQEEEDIQATKNEIKFIKQSDVSSTRNALRIAAQAEETGRATLERLGAQGERIHNTERNLDLASNQNRLAAEKAREIKTLNRSMFAHVANPFTSAKRTREREEEVLRLARDDRERRDQTRAAAWDSQARQSEAQRDLNRQGQPKQIGKQSLADRAKFQFEADSEDEEMEGEIDQNIDLLHGATTRLKNLGLAMGQEVDSQNKHIERIGGKVDKVDDEIALNRNRLDRIK